MPQFISDIFSIANNVTDWLNEISAHWWFLVIIFVMAWLDSVAPIAPSETAVIIGGIAAGHGHHNIVVVILIAALGAFAGDSMSYYLGGHFRPTVMRLLNRDGKAEQRLAAADKQISERGGVFLVTARFIPAGRTIMTLTCGITNRPYTSWFIPWDGTATVIWAIYASLIGYFFGEVFKDNHNLAFWLALATALGLTGLIELIRYLRNKTKPKDEQDLTTI